MQCKSVKVTSWKLYSPDSTCWKRSYQTTYPHPVYLLSVLANSLVYRYASQCFLYHCNRARHPVKRVQKIEIIFIFSSFVIFSHTDMNMYVACSSGAERTRVTFLHGGKKGPQLCPNAAAASSEGPSQCVLRGLGPLTTAKAEPLWLPSNPLRSTMKAL